MFVIDSIGFDTIVNVCILIAANVYIEKVPKNIKGGKLSWHIHFIESIFSSTQAAMKVGIDRKAIKVSTTVNIACKTATLTLNIRK